MKMNRSQHLLPVIVAIFGLLLLGNATIAAAKSNHHDAKQLLGDARKSDGHHDIDHKGKFTTSVEMKNGKVHALHVRHSERGDIPVKKYKTHRKMALNTSGHLVYASLGSAQGEDMGTVYIGYSYIDDNGDEQIYWFPAEMIEDPDTGAVEYVPTS
jgi:hypothetical protein